MSWFSPRAVRRHRHMRARRPIVAPLTRPILVELESRVNPAKCDADMRNVLDCLHRLRVGSVVTIGGDDTAFSASQVYERARGAIRVAHVPKTIDNDLPLPPGVATFGFETARHTGVSIVRNLAEDARTTSRWSV